MLSFRLWLESIPQEPTGVTPDMISMSDMFDGAKVSCTFVILKDGRIWDVPYGTDHVSMLEERPELQHLRSGEEVSDWRDYHVGNSGHIVGDKVYLWGKPSQKEYNALVQKYGHQITQIKYYDYKVTTTPKTITGD